MANDILKPSDIESCSSEVILKFIELVVKCKNLVNVMAFDCGDQRRSYSGDGKDGKKLAASVAVVVGLPSVEVSGGGGNISV
ncbi:hypothetical protein HAX54_039866 [Datura stramonium]|uniref:Uncharacterized protein n=1 Tax=Datura stramonium TaxID=4076 RepID=A0ABS8VLV7_DATST|nr:hypothetical protein [Datura stramonium]